MRTRNAEPHPFRCIRIASPPPPPSSRLQYEPRISVDLYLANYCSKLLLVEIGASREEEATILGLEFNHSYGATSVYEGANDEVAPSAGSHYDKQ